MKVHLIRPNSIIIPTPVPMGILHLASYLRERSDHEVTVTDARNERLTVDETLQRIDGSGPDVVGLSSLSFDAPETHQLAAAIRQRYPDVPVVIGGPYASTSRERVFEDENIDATVIGEGEETLRELLEYFRNGSDGADGDGIPAGTIVRTRGEVRVGPPRMSSVELDELPRPAYDLLDMERYFSKRRIAHNVLQRRQRCVPLITSRGCPYQCVYCHDIFGKTVRFRSPESVLAELEWVIRDYGIGEIEISDDIFNIKLDRAKQIMEGIIRRGFDLKIAFSNGLRADRMDEELVDLLKRAGTYRITYAVEAGSPEVQKRIKKRVNLDRAMEVINYTAARQINTGGFFMLGFPDETAEEMEQTVSFACRSRLHTASFFFVSPFPGTPLGKIAAERTGLDLHKIHFRDYSTMNVNISAISDDQLRQVRKDAYRRFYGSPMRWFRIARVTPPTWTAFRSVGTVLSLSFKDSVNY